jgi:FMN phosphatase YigB (HAD superfamily)
LFTGPSSLYAPFDRGLIEPDEFRLNCRQRLQLSDRLTDEEFDEAYCEVFTIIGPVVDLWQKLRRRGVPVFALSNVDALRFAYVRDRVRHEGVPFVRWFDGLTLSFEEKIAKPDREIFVRALDKAGVKAESARFVDDIVAYAAAAGRMGIPSYVQVPWDVDGLIAFLKGAGLGRYLIDQ